MPIELQNRTDFVRKSDFQRMKRIAGILDHFRCWNLSFIHAGRKEAVQLPDWSCLNRIARADDCKGRIEEIGNGCTFAKKLGVEADQEIASVLLPLAASIAGTTTLSVVPGSTVLRTTIQWNEFFFRKSVTDVGTYFANVRQIQLAVPLTRCADGNERDFGTRERDIGIRSRRDQACAVGGWKFMS